MDPKGETAEWAVNSGMAELKASGSTAKPVELDAEAEKKKNRFPISESELLPHASTFLQPELKEMGGLSMIEGKKGTFSKEVMKRRFKSLRALTMKEKEQLKSEEKELLSSMKKALRMKEKEQSKSKRKRRSSLKVQENWLNYKEKGPSSMEVQENWLKSKENGSSIMELPENWLNYNERKLSRKKDIVCLTLSYPSMNSVNREIHKSWVHDVSKMRHKLRQLKTSSQLKEISSFVEVYSGIEKLLEHSLADIEAYISPIIMKQMCNRTLYEEQPADEKLGDLAVHCATRQILLELGNPEVLKICISGRDRTRVTSALKDLPQVWERFSVVVQLYAPLHQNIVGKIAKQLGCSSDTGELNVILRNTSFLIILDAIDDPVDLYKLGNDWWNSNHNQKIVCTTRSWKVQESMAMDLEIRLEDHLLSWELFCLNVGKVVQSPRFQLRCSDIVEKCCGHLLAVVLIARALEMVSDVSIWDQASHMLSLEHKSQMKDGVLFNALAFILERSVSGSPDECLRHSAFHMEKEGMSKDDLILLWIKHDLISATDDGEKIVGDLVHAFLLESFQNGYYIRMRDEIREVLVNPQFLLQGGKGLTKAPKDDAWEEATWILLMNNKFSELPTSPNCPRLSHLFLQNNLFLRVIPPLFFQYMPMLQILDLSNTKIRSLPHSLYGLSQLQQLYLRGCQLFTELLPEVGELRNLRVLDLERTEIRRLPMDVGNLTNLICLKMWFFYGDNDDRKDNQCPDRIIPQGVLFNLSQLEELIIEVDPNDERWSANAKELMEEVSHLKQLKTLHLYLPEVSLLNNLMNTLPRNLRGMHFRFTVGRHQKRIICRPPLQLAVRFEEHERCLKYVNGGEAVPTKIKHLLRHATALFLDRHSTATSLSEFGFENMQDLKFCVLSECHEIQSIEDYNVNGFPTLPCLEYLNLHYMKNLRSIWKWPLELKSFQCLKALVLHACPQLTTIFAGDSLLEFENLEELVVEDCPALESIVVTRPTARDHLFKKLKKTSLHYLPKLVSFFHGQRVSPALEWISFYDCPSLKTVSGIEFDSEELKVVAGETEWWRELEWSKDFKPPHLDAIFVPIEQDRDFITQLTEINNAKLMHEAEPCQESGTSTLDPPVGSSRIGGWKKLKQKNID